MTYKGKVKNGVVVLEGKRLPPDGAAVSVRVLGTLARRAGRVKKGAPTLYERLKPFIGIADDLPPDASINLDHYLYGAPKEE